VNEVQEQDQSQGVLTRSEGDRRPVLDGVAVERSIVGHRDELYEPVERRLGRSDERRNQLTDQRLDRDEGPVLRADELLEGLFGGVPPEEHIPEHPLGLGQEPVDGERVLAA